MKVLADTCAWSLALRRRNRAALSDAERILVASLGEAIKDGRIVLIGPIRQEILSGIKDMAQFEKLKSALEAFPDEPLATAHYEEAARLSISAAAAVWSVDRSIFSSVPPLPASIGASSPSTAACYVAWRF